MKIIRIGAMWCMNCIFMKSVWQDVEAEFPNLKLEDFDIDEDVEMAKKYDIKDIPIMVFLSENGEELRYLKGAQDKDELIKIIKENINK